MRTRREPRKIRRLRDGEKWARPRLVLYGVRMTEELIESVKEFRQRGTVAPR